jgi:hypothetical protein
MRKVSKTEMTPVNENPCHLGASERKSISIPPENPFLTRKSWRNSEILSVSCLKKISKLSSLKLSSLLE